jgi:hypothetical protein
MKTPLQSTIARRTSVTITRATITRASFALCLLPTLFAADATAIRLQAAEHTVFSDNFTSGSGTTLPNWYRVGSATKPSIQSGIGATPFSGNTLLFSYSKAALVACFDAVTLQNAGDYIEVSYDLYYTTLQTQRTTGAMLGLYDSASTRPSADYTGDAGAYASFPALLKDDRGYSVYKALDTVDHTYGSAVHADLFLLGNTNGFAPLRFSANNTLVEAKDTTSAIAVNTAYSISLKIAVAANGADLDITYSFSGHSVAGTFTKTVPAAEVLTKTFDQIGINLWGGDYAGSGYLDNVLVTTNIAAVPEPSTYALILGSFLPLTGTARRLKAHAAK